MGVPRFLAHSRNRAGRGHELAEHLRATAELARGFADRFGAGTLGFFLGLWHDIGKAHPAFQEYITDPATPRGPDHSSAGAVLGAGHLQILGFPLAGHHGGLPERTELGGRLAEKAVSALVREALSLAKAHMPWLEPAGCLLEAVPGFLSSPGSVDVEFRVEMFIRMLFSSLVDADFLDTEAHLAPEHTVRRQRKSPRLEDLWGRFEADQERLTGKRTDPVNRIRHEIYCACLKTASARPGFFTLTVPTGGGKTRSGMAFALRHALVHAKDRVIVAIPYTSIIEQTADVYRDIFGPLAVLEHHSAVHSGADRDGSGTDDRGWADLAAENWDAPVVVTTTLQFFESLFANRSARCRKLHNIAGSVVILDEVQTLPLGLLQPMLDALQQLVDCYGATVVLCSATQPALQDTTYLRGLRDVREVVSDPQRHFSMLKRVRFELPPPGDRWTWERVAAEMLRTERCLAVLNTKRDATTLLDALDGPDVLHLSTLLCGMHRREVLKEVRYRLDHDLPCRLVSTQVVEAGVDLDFPVVFRAVGPLDSIVQAAGRCNREGRLECGRVVVFDPAEGRVPPGYYRTATDTARVLIGQPGGIDLNDIHSYRTYFERVYQSVNLDAEGIQGLRRIFDYPEVARRFLFIADDSVPVVVPYEAPCRGPVGERLVAALRNRRGSAREVMRMLQPYCVNLRSRAVSDYAKGGMLSQVLPGLWEWHGRYDRIRGLVSEVRDPAELVV